MRQETEETRQGFPLGCSGLGRLLIWAERCKL